MNAYYKLHVHRVIQRTWTSLITPSEMQVVQFICTMTVDWGKTADKLTVKHIVEGFNNVDGTGLCDKTVRTCLKSLMEQGYLLGRRTREGYILGLNLRHFEEHPVLSKPKKERVRKGKPLIAQPKDKSRSVNGYQSRSVNDTVPYILEKHTLKEYIPSRRSATPPPSNSPTLDQKGLRATVEAQNDASRSRRFKKAEKGDYWAIWLSAWLETFPGTECPRLTKKEVGQIDHLLRSASTKTPTAFLAWCVTDWRTIVNACFGWMTDDKRGGPPEYPSVGFILSFKDRFYDGYNRRNKLADEARMAHTDRLRNRYIRDGLSFDEADKAVQARSTIADKAARTSASVQSLNELLRKADERRNARSKSSRVSNKNTVGGGDDRHHGADIGCDDASSDASSSVVRHPTDGDATRSVPGYTEGGESSKTSGLFSERNSVSLGEAGTPDRGNSILSRRAAKVPNVRRNDLGSNRSVRERVDGGTEPAIAIKKGFGAAVRPKDYAE